MQDLVRSCSAMIQPSRAGRRLPEAMLNPDALLRPKRLKPGDRVAALSLSWGGPGVFPHRFEAGVSQLRSEFGLEVVRTRNALLDPGWLAANPKARADDLMEAFADPSMAGIISSIGGDDSSVRVRSPALHGRWRELREQLSYAAIDSSRMLRTSTSGLPEGSGSSQSR